MTIPIRIWMGVTKDPDTGDTIDFGDFVSIVGAEVDITNDIYNENRAGIEFDFSIDEVIVLGEVEEPDLLAACDAILHSGGTPTYWGHAIDPEYLEVIYAQKAGWAGIACDRNRDSFGNVVPDGIADGVVFVDFSNSHDGTVLAHELGHAVGLLPPVGHVNGVTGFEEINVMWPQWAAAFPEERDHLTVGQIFRMNFDSHSWRVIKHSPPGILCQRSMDGDDPCPWLKQELWDIQ